MTVEPRNETELAVVEPVPGSQPPSTRRVRVASLASAVATYSAAITFFLYVTGFVVAGSFLQRAGVPLSAVAHTEYLSAGLLWTSVHALLAFPFMALPRGSRWVYPAMGLVTIGLATLMVFLDAPALDVISYSCFFSVGAGLARMLLRGWTSLRLSALALSMLALAVAFGQALYPAIPRSLGGGQPRRVEIRLSEAFASELDDGMKALLTSPITDTRFRDLYEVYSGDGRLYLAVDAVDFDLKPKRPLSPVSAAKKLMFRLALGNPRDLDTATFVSVPLNAIAVTQHLPRRIPGEDHPVHVAGYAHREELRANIRQTKREDASGTMVSPTEVLARKPLAE